VEDWEHAAVPLLDEHGQSLGRVPNWVGPRELERWLKSAEIAKAFTGKPDGSAEMRMFAEAVYRSDLPLEGIPVDLEEGVWDALAAARAKAARMWRAFQHPRGRLGRFIRKEDGTVGPTPQRLNKPPERSPGAFYTLKDIEDAGLDKWPEKGPKAQEILGDAKDTTALYALEDSAQSPGTIKRVPYKEERAKEHDAWIATFFEGKTPVPEGVRPHAVFMAGGTASGKTTTLEENSPPRVDQEDSIVPPPEHTIHIDADKVKELMTEYQQLREVRDRYAATAVHKESGDIAARMALEAIEQGYHVVIDGTGNAGIGTFSRHLRDAHEAGYKVDVIYVNTPTEQAIEWSIQRAEESGRFVPVPVIRQQHAKVSRNFVEEISKLDFLNSVEIFEDGEHVATTFDGDFIVLDERKFADFIRKRDEVAIDDSLSSEQPSPGTEQRSPGTGRRVWHLTDKADFKLDPDFAPERNTTIGGSGRKGLYVAEDLEPWFNGYDYVRPFAVELEVGEIDEMEGMYAGEKFLPAEAFDDARIVRVIPWDEYIREQYGEKGHFEEFEDPDPMMGPRTKFPDYRYEGPDVRDMSAEEVEQHKARVERYIAALRPHMQRSPGTMDPPNLPFEPVADPELPFPPEMEDVLERFAEEMERVKKANSRLRRRNLVAKPPEERRKADTIEEFEDFREWAEDWGIESVVDDTSGLEIGDWRTVAETMESAFDQYPMLAETLDMIVSSANDHPLSRALAGDMAESAIASITSFSRGPDEPVEVAFSLNDGGQVFWIPPMLFPQEPGHLVPSAKDYTGVVWHEMGHLLSHATGVIPGDDRAADVELAEENHVMEFAKAGITPEEIMSLSEYAASSPTEGFGELMSMMHTPGYADELDPTLREKAEKMFDQWRGK
jgi:predicted ABC-type ATPase